jgi:hypothetical protein
LTHLFSPTATREPSRDPVPRQPAFAPARPVPMCCNGRRSERVLQRKKEHMRLEGSPRRSMVHGSPKAAGVCRKAVAPQPTYSCTVYCTLHTPACFRRKRSAASGARDLVSQTGTAPAGTAARPWLRGRRRGRTDALIALVCCFWWRNNASERSSVRPSTLVTFIVYSRQCRSSLARRLHEAWILRTRVGFGSVDGGTSMPCARAMRQACCGCACVARRRVRCSALASTAVLASVLYVNV